MKLVRRYTPEYSTNRDFDAELVCSGHKLNSHRLVLAGASVFLASILQESESDETVVLLPEYKPEDVQQVLNLLYGADHELPGEEDLEIFKILRDLGIGTFLEKSSEVVENGAWVGCEVKVEISKLKEELDSSDQGSEYHHSIRDEGVEEERDLLLSADVCLADFSNPGLKEDEPLSLSDNKGFHEKIAPLRIVKGNKTGERKGLISCSECEFSTGKVRNLQRHMHRIHPGIKVNVGGKAGDFSCNQCEYTTNYKYNLQRHKERFHSGIKKFKNGAPVRSYPCDQCEFFGESWANIKEHKNKAHKRRPSIFHHCNYCEQVESSKKKLRIHKLSAHSTEPAVSGSVGQNGESRCRWTSCNKCDFITPMIKDLKVHMMAEHNCLKFQCDECTYECVLPRSLRLHKAKHHEGVHTQHSCNKCEFTTIDLPALKSHMKSNHDCLKYLCDQCAFECMFSASLLLHRRRVHDNIKFPCNECEYIGNCRSNLRQHLDTKHRGVKYMCDQCEYSTSTPYKLKAHSEVAHEGIRFKCDECEHITTTKKNLLSHKSRVHERIRFPCDECCYGACSKYKLKLHKKKRHPVKELI